MRVLIYALAVLLAGLGLIFVVGAQGQVMRVAVGIILVLGAAGLIALIRLRPQQTTVVHQVDLSGDVNLQELSCKSCGGRLGRESVTVKAGAVFVHCPYCGADYQLEEEPKW